MSQSRYENVLGIPAYTDQEALANFIDAVRVAESACKQMALYTSDHRWILVEEKLSLVRENGIKMAQQGLSARGGFT